MLLKAGAVVLRGSGSLSSGRPLSSQICWLAPQGDRAFRVEAVWQQTNSRRTTTRPSFRSKPGDKGDFLKRRTPEQGKAEIDAAHVATHRLYCDALMFWRRCKLRTCKRHRRCCGEPSGCLMRGLIHVPQALRLKAQKEVIAGGKRRIPPATHAEWTIRRNELKTLVEWGFG